MKDKIPDINITIDSQGEVDITSLTNFIVQSLSDDKIDSIKNFNLKDRGDLTKNVIIGTGTSSRHIVAASEKLADKIKQTFSLVINIEGTTKAPQWILIDLQDVMVHLFTEEAREKYDLESLYIKGS